MRTVLVRVQPPQPTFLFVDLRNNQCFIGYFVRIQSGIVCTTIAREGFSSVCRTANKFV